MKKITYSLILFILIFAFCYQGKCATEEWTYDGMSNIFQIVADGKGGCSFTRLNGVLGGGTADFDIVWLDKKGALIYSAPMTNSTFPGMILGCTSKQLLFADKRPNPVFIQVDQNGVESIVPSPAGKYNMMPMSTLIPVSLIIQDARITDKKGFFLVENNTNTYGATLIRYSNK